MYLLQYDDECKLQCLGSFVVELGGVGVGVVGEMLLLCLCPLTSVH